MFHFDPLVILEVAARSAIVYLFLVIALRLTGKRELGQLSPVDLVLLLLLSNAVQNAMVGSDSSLTGGLVAASTLLLLNTVLTFLRMRSPTFNRLVDDQPTQLVHNGVLLTDNLRNQHISADDVLQALREHGVDQISQCLSAVLEVDGSISVIVGGEVSNRPPPAQMRRRRKAGMREGR